MNEMEAAARKRTIKKIVSMPLWYTVDELCQLMLPYSPDALGDLHDWTESGRIFIVEDDNQTLVGKFQFDEEFRPFPIIGEILTLLDKRDSWAIAAWFVFLNSWVADRNGKPQKPVDTLVSRDPLARDMLLVAARSERETHFA